MLNILTPGPTKVRENVRLARALPTTNPDLDPAFFDFYKQTCSLLSKFLHTKNPSYILSGEGILGLEAACASLTEPGHRVLVLDNGIYGKYFADFVTLYGGDPVFYTTDMRAPIDSTALSAYLSTDSDFAYATLVHCDTPSGVLNDVHALCPILKKHGILSVVDSVSGMFGHDVNIDKACIDVLCGGSQKALCAPAGLTCITVSPAAMATMKARTTPIRSCYGNIAAFENYYDAQWFPYTMPASDIEGFACALGNVLDEPSIFSRHTSVASRVRASLLAGGLSLYLRDGFANTVTAVCVPDGLDDTALLAHIRDTHNILLAGSFDVLAHKVIRIGHMGEAANDTDMALALDALTQTLAHLGAPAACDMGAYYRSL